MSAENPGCVALSWEGGGSPCGGREGGQEGRQAILTFLGKEEEEARGSLSKGV